MSAPRPVPRLGLALAIACGCLACGGDAPERATPTERAPAASAASLEEAAGGRTVVATVNGRPIYDDCVATQAAAAPSPDLHAALDDCIGFELLAQAAEAAGYLAHPEVLEARKTEAARRLIDEEFAARFHDPSQIPDDMVRGIYQANRMRWDHPEYRFFHLVRVRVPPAVERGSAEDLAALALAQDIAGATAAATTAAFAAGRETGLDKKRFGQLAQLVAGDVKLEATDYNTPLRGRAVPEVADAVFAIPKVGLISPPTRTRWGWDVFLLTKIMPERRDGYEVAAAEIRAMLFDDWRRAEFDKWSRALVAGVPHEVDPSALERVASASTVVTEAVEGRPEARAPAAEVSGD